MCRYQTDYDVALKSPYIEQMCMYVCVSWRFDLQMRESRPFSPAVSCPNKFYQEFIQGFYQELLQVFYNSRIPQGIPEEFSPGILPDLSSEKSLHDLLQDFRRIIF